MNSLYIYILLFIGAFALAGFIKLWWETHQKRLDDILNYLDKPDYPEIDIRYDVTGKPLNIEYCYRIQGTCNKIDYIEQRFRGWPTKFQIDRFRYHCIYEYEKSGKSKVIDYDDCDGYEESYVLETGISRHYKKG